MLRALIILVITTARIKGEIDRRDVEVDTIEFSKLNTDAF
jgi:hypothetical protein